MKIIIEPETKEEKERVKKETFEDVKEIMIFGSRSEKKLIPQDFNYWYGSYSYLIGRMYYLLKKLERLENKIGGEAK
jgi:hypothetical protein